MPLESIVLSLEVQIYDGESQDSLLRRFQRETQTSGIIREIKTRSQFMNKRDTARMKARNNARRKRRQNRGV
jgi:ribosomal protein S21